MDVLCSCAYHYGDAVTYIIGANSAWQQKNQSHQYTVIKYDIIKVAFVITRPHAPGACPTQPTVRDYKNPLHLDVVDRYLRQMGYKRFQTAPPCLESFIPLTQKVSWYLNISVFSIHVCKLLHSTKYDGIFTPGFIFISNSIWLKIIAFYVIKFHVNAETDLLTFGRRHFDISWINIIVASLKFETWGCCCRWVSIGSNINWHGSGVKQRHYLNQWWPSSLTHMCIGGIPWVKLICNYLIRAMAAIIYSHNCHNAKGVMATLRYGS